MCQTPVIRESRLLFPPSTSVIARARASKITERTESPPCIIGISLSEYTQTTHTTHNNITPSEASVSSFRNRLYSFESTQNVHSISRWCDSIKTQTHATHAPVQKHAHKIVTQHKTQFKSVVLHSSSSSSSSEEWSCLSVGQFASGTVTHRQKTTHKRIRSSIAQHGDHGAFCLNVVWASQRRFAHVPTRKHQTLAHCTYMYHVLRSTRTRRQSLSRRRVHQRGAQAVNKPTTLMAFQVEYNALTYPPFHTPCCCTCCVWASCTRWLEIFALVRIYASIN